MLRNYGKLTIYATLFFVLINLSCKDNPTAPPIGVNLITNPTFELNGSPSLWGWQIIDSTAVRITDVVPAGATGHSVLMLRGRGFGENLISTSVHTYAGRHVFKLSCWCKRIGVSGIIYHQRNHDEDTPQGNGITPSDTVWKYYSRIDSIPLNSNDSLFIQIVGPYWVGSPTEYDTSWFFNPKFELLD
jgi:hypothetical protein